MTREEYQNRVLGCFVGKNIGGTLGMPMEWERSKNDVTYYTHDITGDPLPNDDLDIQILWLLALEEQGLHIDSKILGQYFNEYMIFTHAEYGVAKTNLRAGLQPPVAPSTTNLRTAVVPTSVRISGHAYFREIRKRQQNMLLRMRLWIMETERASMQKYSWQPWRVQPFMKGISVN